MIIREVKQLWSDAIHGQNLAIQLLQSALKKDMLSQSYIFSGPDGVGRRFTALRLAMAVQCDEGLGIGCGICPSCQKLLRGTHPDWHLLEPDGNNIRIDQIRELHSTISRRPHQGRRRIAVLDPADKMNDPAANAMLRLLEQPPADSLLILISDNPLRLLPTIRSRCQNIRFTSLSLLDLSTQIPQDLSADKSQVLLRLAHGSMGRLHNLLQDEEWDEERRQNISWYLEEATWSELQRLKFAEERDGAWRQRYLWKTLWTSWLSLSRDRLMLDHQADETQLWNPDYKVQLLSLPHLSTKQMVQRIYSLTEADRQLEANTPPRMIAESLLLSWI